MPHIATEKVLRGLDDDSNQYFMAGRKNKITDVALSISGILASLAATVLAATHVLLWITAAVATVRACASIQKVVDVRGRSGWYIRHVALVRSLASALKYAKIPDVEEFARKRGELEVEMEREWSQIGRSGVMPSVRRRKPVDPPRSGKAD